MAKKTDAPAAKPGTCHSCATVPAALGWPWLARLRLLLPPASSALPLVRALTGMLVSVCLLDVGVRLLPLCSLAGSLVCTAAPAASFPFPRRCWIVRRCGGCWMWRMLLCGSLSALRCLDWMDDCLRGAGAVAAGVPRLFPRFARALCCSCRRAFRCSPSAHAPLCPCSPLSPALGSRDALCQPPCYLLATTACAALHSPLL
jgi:hypothetical protein